MTVFIRTSKRTELQGRFPSARSRLVLNRDHWVNDRLLFALVWSHHDRFQELRTGQILPITVSGITVTEKATSELGLAYKMVDGSVQSASVSSFATLPTQGQSFSQFMAYDYADPLTQYLGGIGGGLDSNKTTSFGAFVTPGRFRFGVYNGGQAEMTQTASGVIFHSGWMIGDGSSSSYGIHCAVNQFPSVSSTATWTGYVNNNIYPQSLGSYTSFRFYNYIKVWLYWKRAISHAEHISLYSPDTRWSYLHDLGARHYSIGAGILSLSPAAAQHAHSAGTPGLDAKYAATPAAAQHTHTAGTPGLDAKYAVDAADAEHGHSAGEPGLTAADALGINDALHALYDQAGYPFLFQYVPYIFVGHGTHGHSAGEPGLDAKYAAAPADAEHGHSAGEVGLVIQGVLSGASAQHTHSAGTPGLDAKYAATPADAEHGHSAGEPGVTPGAQALAIAAALHAHAAGEPGLTAHYVVIVSAALHAHVAQNVTFPSTLIHTPRANVIRIMADDTTIYILDREPNKPTH